MSAKVSCTVLRGGERGDSRTLPDLFRLGNENYSQINERLNMLLENHVEDLQSGSMISVNSKSFRVRKLPIE